ncbi:ATP-dependent RNA helicase TDRD9 [Pelobates cultripes]|uniref:RNA helicase n=1 Tax=Pelobates cultripes TaxID=61616 RepID=A0AAD1TNT6_PELCU|nr:ATP-dependent RNA helicase TDRD9 [Pelobates cultripes]
MAASLRGALTQAYQQKPLGVEPWMHAFDRICAQFWAKIASRQVNASPRDQHVQVQPRPVRRKEATKHLKRTSCKVLKGKRETQGLRPMHQCRHSNKTLHGSYTARHSGWGRNHARKSCRLRIPAQRGRPRAPKRPRSPEPGDGTYRNAGRKTQAHRHPLMAEPLHEARLTIMCLQLPISRHRLSSPQKFSQYVHERTEEMDFLLLIVRKLLRTNSRLVKVILMSATINCNEFAEYFAMPVLNKLIPAYIFEVEGKPHDVELFYLDDLKHLPRIKSLPTCFREPYIYEELYDIATYLIQYFDDLEKEQDHLKNPTLATEPNSVLFFLPGLHEINCMHERFTNMVQKRLQVYPLHSSINLDEQNSVFMTPILGYRKIILSTNIAESSITVPDVKYVIDFCLTKTLVCDEETNYQSLRLSWASKANCDQRKGRAGRVSKGYCYRLIQKDFWNNIPDVIVPEMQRKPLGSTILKVKLLDMGEPRVLLSTALSPPRISDIERTILLLKEVGALAVNSNQEDENPYNGELTFLGKVLAQLPVDLQLGKLIVLGHVFGCLDECLIIAAALSLRSFFAMPFRQLLDGYRSKLTFSANSRSDCIALVDAFKLWRDRKTRGELAFPKDELEWGRANYFQIKRLRDVSALYEELKERVSHYNMHVTSNVSTDPDYKYKQRFVLQIVMAGAFYPNYFTYSEPDEATAIKELGGKDPKTTVVLKNIPPYGFLYHKQIQSFFRQCGQVKSILFDGAKAFVEFSRNPTVRFNTQHAVHLAIKMCQLKVPLPLNFHSAEQIEEKCEGSVDLLKHIRVNVDLHKQIIEPIHMSQMYSEQTGTIKRLTLSINVTEVVEVGHFWGYRNDEQNVHVLGNLTEEINSNDLRPLSGRPHPDMLCLAPYVYMGRQNYFRAQIEYVTGNCAVVFFVDYGNQSKVELNLLREIPNYLLEFPFQALEFKICKMRPSAKSIISGEQWSSAANARFDSLVNGCTLVVKVFSIIHGLVHVEAHRMFEILEEMSIRDILIADGFAEPAEESYESKQSNEILKEMFSTSINETPSFSMPEQKETKSLINSVLKSFTSNKLGDPYKKVPLRGPYHPFEVQFHSMTNVSRFRSVWLEKESINSVVVNDTPEATYQRLFVAASVSVNASGSAIILRETSLMPSIPGLPALVAMLFAPVIELRVNKNQSEYIGAVCGLGWDPSSNSAVWPEHDIELAFDAHITIDDLLKVNGIRSAVNNIVSHHHDGCLRKGQGRTEGLQENVREKLFNLFQRDEPRAIVTAKWDANLYKWNQVDPKFLIDQAFGLDEERHAIYQLHKLVMLNA